MLATRGSWGAITAVLGLVLAARPDSGAAETAREPSAPVIETKRTVEQREGIQWIEGRRQKVGVTPN